MIPTYYRQFLPFFVNSASFAKIVDMSKSWAEEQAARIAETIKALRGKRSGQWLSDRTAEVGHRVSRTTISELENGKRKSVTTAELCVLAWALDVPPVRILYPSLPDGEVELVPGVRTQSTQAMAWFSGEVTFEPEIRPRDKDTLDQDEWQRRVERAAEVQRGAELVRLSRDRIRLESQIESLTKTVKKMREADADDIADTLVPEIASAQNQLDTVNKQLRARTDSTVNP